MKKNGATKSPPKSATFTDTSIPEPKPNVNPALIAKALTEMLDFDTRMASIAGMKGASIRRYEVQGVDRELLAALNKLARKDKNEAQAYLSGLARYAVAADVVRLADADWARSVKQSDMFAPAYGEDAENLRFARAKKQGFFAGKKGHALESNPYSKVGSPEFSGWRDGHGGGLELRKAIKPGSENVQKGAAVAQPRAASRKKAAEAAEEGSQLDKDTAAYRAKGTSNLADLPTATDTRQ